MTLLGAQPRELGTVAWLRDLQVALQRSKATGRPVLILFDEVPGCSTVLGFGETVLSDAAIVATIEQRFVPLAIYNNVDGADREVLRVFGEPAWNNPVVRVIDSERRPLAPRFDGPYTKAAFTAYLDAVDAAAPTEHRLVVSGPCFWECEARIGAIDGVSRTRVGFLEGAEVVEAHYDATRISSQALLDAVRALGCAERVFPARAAIQPSPKDTKYYLARSKFAEVPMSETTACRVNAALRRGEDPTPLLKTQP
jgi:hypothetical protein